MLHCTGAPRLLERDVRALTGQIGVALIDDDSFARKGLGAVIEAEPGLSVVGEAADYDEALVLVQARGVDVLVVDALFNEHGCLRLTREIGRRDLEVSVIVLGRSGGDDYVLGLVQAGVAGYLRKTVPPHEFVSAVRAVAAGGRVMDPRVLDVVLRDYGERCEQASGMTQSVLTERQRQVVTLVAEGLSSREIAGELSLSHRTVEAHRRRIMERLGLRTVVDLVRYAVREGLVGLDPP